MVRALAPADNARPGIGPSERLQHRRSARNLASGYPIHSSRAKGGEGETKTWTLAATAARELIDKGAVAIIVTCDFDYSAPATFAARDAKIPALSFCAASPKAATPAIVGDYAGSMGEGSDTEGVTMAEWIANAKPDWKRAYVLRDTFFDNFKAKYGDDLTVSHPQSGYDLATALAAAIDAAGGTDGPAIAESLFSLPKIDTLVGPVRFTPECHRPQPSSHLIEEYTDGKATVIERWAVESIPDIGDGSSCAGEQIAVPQ